MEHQIIFKTPYRYYLYDRNSNEIVPISFSEYEKLEAGKDLSADEYQELESKGILFENEVEKIEHPENGMLNLRYERKVSVLTLQITQQCNLRCGYCVYSGNYQNRTHSNKSMSDEIAKKSIDFLAEHSIDSTKVHIGFYGGEPLLRFPFIKMCMEYAKDRLAGKEITYSLTTNATLLTEEIVSYFEENNVMLTISLDGDKESHDSNRKFANTEIGSFDVIQEKLKMVLSRYPKYFSTLSFNVVIDPGHSFKNLCDYFKNNELFRNANITAGLISGQYAQQDLSISEEFMEQYGYELFKYFLYKLNRLEKKDVSNLFEGYFSDIKKLENRSYGPLGKVEHHGGPCIPGIQRLFVSVDGNLYPCERVDENSKVMKIGTVYDGFDIDNAIRILNIGKLTNDECINCWALRLCTICAALADDRESFSKEKKLLACQEVKKKATSVLTNYCMLKELGY